MKRVIVTGASGFIGRHILAPLVDRGFEVYAVARSEPMDFAAEEIHWRQVDLLDSATVERFCRDTSASHLIHFAWYVEHGKFWNAPENDLWVSASRQLLESFKRYGGRRIVAAGTSAEYELGGSGFLSECASPLRPANPYGKAKKELFESLASSDIRWAWGRIFFLYGAGESPNRLVASVINSLLKGETAKCSHGNQLRDFLYVKDVADAFAAILESDLQGPVNIASGEPITIRELVLTVADLLSKRENVRFGALPASAEEPSSVVADVARLREEVGWHPAYSLRDGLAETIQWWQKR
jgi:nucleoside-diphosphate-sugar epimerase